MTRKAGWWWCVCIGVLLVVACQGAATDATASTPAEIRVVAGSTQTAPVNTELPNWIRFLVTDPAGRGVPGVHVTLDASEGEGDVVVNDMITDATGSIILHWTLGPLSGTQALVARVEYLDSAAVTATATGCDLPECPEYELVDNQEVDVSIPTYDLTGQVVHPDVVRRKVGTGPNWYWLAITPYPNANTLFENPSIYRSDNGRYWRVPKGVVNPVVRPTVGFNSDPDLTLDEATNTFWLYFRLVAFDQNYIMVTKSPNGITWTAPDTVFAAPSHNAVSPAVVHDGPHAPWQMWVVNSGPDGCVSSSGTVELRTSTDGMRWSPPTTTDLQQPGKVIWHLDVRWIPARNEYWALYTTHELGLNCATTALYLARSPDGLTWTIPQSPIYHSGTMPLFRDVVYRSSFLTSDDGTFTTLWLSGANYDGIALRWSAATARRRTEDLIRISDSPPQSVWSDLPARLLPVPEPWDMPRRP